VVVATHNESLTRRFHHPTLHLEAGELTQREPAESPAA